MNNSVHRGSGLVSVLITTILAKKKKKIEFVRKKRESSELPAPDFSCLIHSLRPVLVTKLQGSNREVKKNYVSLRRIMTAYLNESKPLD